MTEPLITNRLSDSDEGRAHPLLEGPGVKRQAPPSRDDVRIFRFGAEAGSHVDYYIYRDVLDELVFAAGYEDEPSFAIVTGGFGVDGVRGFVEMTGFEHFFHADADLEAGAEDRIGPGVGVDFGLGADVDTKIGEACLETQQQAGDDYPVGLFAAVRGCKGIIPDAIARLHFTYFNVPFQPLLLLDPDTRDLVVYGRAPRRPFLDAPLFVVTHDASLAHDTDSA